MGAGAGTVSDSIMVMKYFVRFFLVLFCLQGVSATAHEVVDQAGRKRDVPDDPRRIVSLAPNITEMVFFLGEQDRLAGATQYSDYPAAAKKLPRVGSYIRLDLEKIVALKPDLCLGIKDGNPLHVVNRIEELGIPVYVVNPTDLNGIIDVVQRFGDLFDVEAKSRILVNNMRQRIDKVRRMVAASGTRPRVFFQIDAAPIISAGENTFIHELIITAGGRNTATGSGLYPRYNWEEILVLQPEIAIVASMAGGHSVEELKAGWYRWPQIPAVANGRVHVVDANLIDRPTPRLIEALEIFASIIHPEVFGETSGQ